MDHPLINLLPAVIERNPSWSRSDVIALTAAVISLFTFAFTLISIYLNKQLEIKFLKFDKLVLTTLDHLFEPLDKIFTDNPNNNVSSILTIVTESLVDIELFLIQFKGYYSTLELDEIVQNKERFSDYLYNNSTIYLKDAKITYWAFRTKVFFELYEFARKNDIGHFNRLIVRIKVFHKNKTITAIGIDVVCLVILVVLYLIFKKT